MQVYGYISTMQVYGHIAESSSNYKKPKQHHMLCGTLSNATMAQMLLLTLWQAPG